MSFAVSFVALLLALFPVLAHSFSNSAPTREHEDPWEDREESDFSIPDDSESARYLVTFQETVCQPNGVAIVLSDDSYWIVTGSRSGEHPTKLLESWKKGEEVRIATRASRKKKGDFILKNIHNQEALLVDFDTTSKYTGGAVIIYKIDTFGYSFSMSDGGDWTIDRPSSVITSQWERGERVLINKSACPGPSHLLINLDRKESVVADVTTWK